MFHLSLPVDDLNRCEAFYREVFGADIRRIRPDASNIYIFAAQLTLHERPGSAMTGGARAEMHFGQVVSIEDWRAIHIKLADRGVAMRRCIEPDVGEQRKGKMLFQDPSGNLIEINSQG